MAFQHLNIISWSFRSNLLLLFIIIVYNVSWGQDHTDSLKNKNFEDLKKLIYQGQGITDTIKTKQIAKVYLNKAQKLKDTKEIVNGYLYLINASDLEKQLPYNDSIIAITKDNSFLNFPSHIYFNKAQYFLFYKRNIPETLQNLTEARKYALIHNNTNLLFRIDYTIGIVKSEHLNEKEEALSIFKKCERFYEEKEAESFQSKYMNTLHVIAETYVALNKNDSATYYNAIGYHKATKSDYTSVKDMKAYFSLCEGINQYNEKNYTAALDSINKSLPTMIIFDDISNIIDSYFYLGKSHHDLGQKEEGFGYFLKTDSILETLESTPQYKHVKTYEYLKDYYKQKDDLENQNRYLNKLNTVLDNYLGDQMRISNQVKEDYDIPLLLEEQEAVIEKLNTNTKTYISSIWILVLSLLILAALLLLQYRKKRNYRIRFEKLLAELKSNNRESISTNSSSSVKKSEELKVPEKHVKHILEKLTEFENNQGFLATGLSSQGLADSIDTNVKYLSRVINHYKNKSFTNYLNELRITFALKELKENHTLRKYTVKAIAHEFGYNSAETFSTAFYKQAQIKPSYYIKQLEKRGNETIS